MGSDWTTVLSSLYISQKSILERNIHIRQLTPRCRHSLAAFVRLIQFCLSSFHSPSPRGTCVEFSRVSQAIALPFAHRIWRSLLPATDSFLGLHTSFSFPSGTEAIPRQNLHPSIQHFLLSIIRGRTS